MRGTAHLTIGLITGVATAGLVPGVAVGQTTRLTTYYDSARTQRRAVYGILLRGSRPDTIPHGPYRRFWRSGSLEEIGHFTEGLADSIWTRYYPARAGQGPAVSRRLPMRAGQPDGAFTVVHSDGLVAQRGVFRKGLLVDSLVTTTKEGKLRLLAQFTSNQAGIAGSFRQWYSSVTAQSIIELVESSSKSYLENNPYPRYDPGRYWTGQLAAGRLVGHFTEKDTDGQPRVSLLFDPNGHLQMVTNYYPARWRRHELLDELRDSARAARSRSTPCSQIRVVGPWSYLLQRTWDWEADSALGVSRLSLPAGEPRHPAGSRCEPPAGAVAHRLSADSLMDAMCRQRSFWAVVPKRPTAPAVSKWRETLRLIQDLPVPYRQQYWRLAETDPATGKAMLQKRREICFPSGQLAGVETAHGYKVFDKAGQLVRSQHITRRGVRINRYYKDGRLRTIRWHRPDGESFARFRNHNGRMPLFRHYTSPPHFR